MSMNLVPIGRRSIHDNGSTKYVNVPVDVEDFGFPREGQLTAFYDKEADALVFRPAEKGGE